MGYSLGIDRDLFSGRNGSGVTLLQDKKKIDFYVFKAMNRKKRKKRIWIYLTQCNK